MSQLLGSHAQQGANRAAHMPRTATALALLLLSTRPDASAALGFPCAPVLPLQLSYVLEPNAMEFQPGNTGAHPRRRCGVALGHFYTTPFTTPRPKTDPKAFTPTHNHTHTHSPVPPCGSAWASTTRRTGTWALELEREPLGHLGMSRGDGRCACGRTLCLRLDSRFTEESKRT
jgi:hypothetical protein